MSDKKLVLDFSAFLERSLPIVKQAEVLAQHIIDATPEQLLEIQAELREMYGWYERDALREQFEVEAGENE